MSFDVIVVGLGAVGSAAAYHLARMGAKVLGIDRFSPPHKFGSSHGDTRITRAAVGEGVEYSPLAMRSHVLWRDIERQTGKRLYVRCGCLTISGPRGAAMHEVAAFFPNVAEAARRYRIPHQSFASGAAVRARFPQFAVADDEQAILDEDGGYVLPEACIAAQLELARRNGATLLTDTPVAAIAPERGGVRVTAGGNTYVADRVLIAAGAWLPRLAGAAVGGNFTVTRQVLHWFEVTRNAERFADSVCPVFIWQLPLERGVKTDVYGFPLTGDINAGVKVTHEESGGVVNPDTVRREVTDEEIAATYRTYIAPFFPDLGPRCLRTEVCLYTRARNARFVIDALPSSDRVMFASACSGHGFKHSAALGEALAEWMVQGRPAQVDLAPFTLERLAAQR